MILLFAVNLVRTLIIIAAIYFALRFISKLVKANAVQQQANRQMADQLRSQQERNQQVNQQQRKQRTVKDDGETRVEYVKKRKAEPGKGNDPDDDEYIDFEEVK